jgi:hypothetical protein
LARKPVNRTRLFSLKPLDLMVRLAALAPPPRGKPASSTVTTKTPSC